MTAKLLIDYLTESDELPRLTGRQLQESPQLYPGSVVYALDSKFRPITARNFSEYTVLRHDTTFTYALDPQHTTGFVFTNADVLRKPSTGMVPVLHVQLRDSGIKGYKQAHHLRIRYTYSMKGVATGWYLAYVHVYGGVVSDFEHLEGGKSLWKSFVRTALDRGFIISAVDTKTGVSFPLSADTPDSVLWSTDASKRSLVLVLESRS